MTQKQKVLLSLAFVLTLSALYIYQPKVQETFGSVNSGNEYQATTTRQYPATSLTDPTQLCPDGGGTLGSVVITGANTGIMNFHNGTTTSNHSLHATTTLVTIPASTVAGTYTFDVAFSRGVIFDLDGGLMPTTTITYKCN